MIAIYSAKFYRVVVVVGAAVLAAVLVALVATQRPANAAFPGENGKIAFHSNRNTPEHTNPEGDFEILTMEPDGSDIEQLTDNGADDSWPAFSPDGKQISFLSSRDGNSEIYTMNADGSNQARLTHNTTEEGYPAFFPDGERIVFATDRDGNSEIYTMNTDGSNQTRLTHNAAYDADTSVSPEGKIAFTSDRDGNFEVYTMNADGSNQTRLTHNAAYDGRDAQPNYSPDGKQITFESTRNGNAEIYVMNTDGSNQTRLTFNEGWLPSFSPNGKKITFFSSRDGNEEVYVMNADGSNQTRLTNNPASDRATDWQPQPTTPSDTKPPKVVSHAPKANATEVAPTANVRATFSEEMDRNTINGTTFTLFKKGTTTQIPATVTYNAATDTAKLDPTNNLREEVAYKAVVTTWAKDVAGNRLDQDSSTSGLQQKRWFFRVDD